MMLVDREELILLYPKRRNPIAFGAVYCIGNGMGQELLRSTS